jgi:predicted transcriptional regulator
MKKRKLTVKVSSLDEALATFKNVWEKAEAGEKLAEPIEIVGFENASLLMKVLTPRRLELLQRLHTIGTSSVRALAKELARDYSNVYQDVRILSQVGLLQQDKKGRYSMPWDKIITEIPMNEWTPSRHHVSKTRTSHSHHSAQR